METMAAINALIQQNAALLTMVGLLGGLFVYWKNGGVGMNKTIIDGFRTRVELMQADINRLTNEDANNKKEIGILQGTITEKEKQIGMMKELLTNRNPEMERFIKQMTSALASGAEQQRQAAQYMKDSMGIFQQILIFMKKLDEVKDTTTRSKQILEGQEQRHDERARHKKGSEKLDENK